MREDGTCFGMGLIAREGSFQGGKGTTAKVNVNEDLGEVGWSEEVDS